MSINTCTLEMAMQPAQSDVNKTGSLRVLRTGPLFDNNFGFDILHKDLFCPFVPAPIRYGYFRPWRQQYCRKRGMSDTQDSQDGFKVNFDVQQFKPDEINVKMVDNHIVVEGKHEERQDEHGYISRGFQRRYKLPDNVITEALETKLSSDGVLSIEAPKKRVEPQSKERIIQIIHTNAPAVTSSAPLGAVKSGSFIKETAGKIDG